jgi:hypothetical protein
MATDKPASGRGKGFAGLTDLVSEVPGVDVSRSTPDKPIRAPLGTVVLDPTSANDDDDLVRPIPDEPIRSPRGRVAPEPRSVNDDDDLIRPIPDEPVRPPRGSAVPESRTAFAPEKSTYRPREMPTGNEPMPAIAKWLLGLVGLMIIFGIVNSTSKKVDPTTYNKPPTSYNAPQAPAPLELLYESIPPVGSGQLLNFVQLRYCIGETIRLDALEVFGRNNVKRYNAKVKFFNDRCSSYRYKVTDFNSVTQDMRDRKDLLSQQARLEWFKADELEAKSNAKAAKSSKAF